MDAFEKESLKSKLEWELEETIIDRLNGERVELSPVGENNKFFIVWLSRFKKRVVTGVTITAGLIEFLKAKIDTNGHDDFVEDINLIQDFIDMSAFHCSSELCSWIIDTDIISYK